MDSEAERTLSVLLLNFFSKYAYWKYNENVEHNGFHLMFTIFYKKRYSFYRKRGILILTY